jgi:hypothetical protein
MCCSPSFLRRCIDIDIDWGLESSNRSIIYITRDTSNAGLTSCCLEWNTGLEKDHESEEGNIAAREVNSEEEQSLT